MLLVKKNAAEAEVRTTLHKVFKNTPCVAMGFREAIRSEELRLEAQALQENRAYDAQHAVNVDEVCCECVVMRKLHRPQNFEFRQRIVWPSQHNTHIFRRIN